MPDGFKPIFSWSLSGAGRDKFSNVHFCLYEEVAPGIHQVAVKVDVEVPLEGDQRDAREWMREVLHGFLETL